jgi:hypothetical protein
MHSHQPLRNLILSCMLQMHVTVRQPFFPASALPLLSCLHLSFLNQSGGIISNALLNANAFSVLLESKSEESLLNSNLIKILLTIFWKT